MKRERFAAAYSFPVEAEIRPDGSVTIIEDGIMISSDSEMAEELARKIEEVEGGEISFDSVEPGSNSSFFAFSSRKWRGSRWEPNGPKPPWSTKEPANPDLN